MRHKHMGHYGCLFADGIFDLFSCMNSNNCSDGFNWKQTTIGLDTGLVIYRRQANDVLAYWRLNVSSGFDVLMKWIASTL